MLKKHHTLFFQILLFVLLASSFSCLFADDLEDAKDAYGAGQFEEAATLLGPLIRQKNMDAVYLLARMYEKGDGINEDLTEAKRLYRLAAKNGNTAAQQRLDIFDAQGADDSVVIDWYLPSANEGDTEAQYNLGYMYETGWGVRVNEKKAIRWYQEAAEAQHDVAQLRLGLMYIVGVAGTQSLDNGLSLLRRSAENGNRIAEALVQDLFDADDVSLRNAVRVVAGIRRVIDEGEKETLQSLRRSLALMHKNKNKKKVVKKTNSLVLLKKEMLAKSTKTVVVKKEIVKNKNEKIIAAAKIDLPAKIKPQQPVAIKKESQKINKPVLPINSIINDHDASHAKGNLFNWYFERATQGDADSQFQLGAMYIKGQQVGTDIEEGIRWIGIAAKQNFDLAEIYMELWNKKNTESSIAVEWLKDAGRSFNKDAIFNLAFMYETGRGVQINTKLAKQWYKLAAAEGHAEAKKRYSLTKAEVFSDEVSTVSPALRINLSFPLMIGSLLVVLIGIFIFIFFQRNKDQSVSIPPLNGMTGYKATHEVNKTRDIPIEDRSFIDELWASPNSSLDSEIQIPGFESDKSTEKSPNVAKEKESPSEFNEVDKKLSEAIDMLMGAKQAESTDSIVDETTVSQAVEKESSNLPTENEIIADVLTRTKNKPKTDNLSKKVLENFKFDDANDVDEFLSDNISIDELGNSRISADSFFADGISIEEAVKTNKRPNREVKKITANEVLNIENVGSNSVKSNSATTKPSKKPKNIRKPPRKKIDELPNFGDSSIPTLEKVVNNESNKKENNQKRAIIDQEIIEIVEPIYPSENKEERALSEVHFNIGMMFSNGDGVPQNDSQAAKWFLKAAEEDMPAAQFSIGQCYLTGAGVQKNTAIAMDWIQKAADSHYKPAMDELQKKNKAS